ncbi:MULTISPECIES: hypothetical protein [Erythrobacter]|uniref:hypothetical protein n=1 Tax=Erythrobacter TaxID=1041 RepID=UPI0004D8B78B|nr:hypothetical protein [Erythrobacter aurantius]KEO88262.1 hypothetical protein EH30_02470 [Erythrobacter sp. JL475]
MKMLHDLVFASDAVLMALAGLGFWLFAGFCLVMDRLRTARRSLDRLERVGWVPWTGLFLGSAIIGGGCLAMSLPVVLGNM